MTDFLISQIQAITGSARAAAKRALDTVLSDNAMMLVSLAEHAIQSNFDTGDSFLYGTLDDALWGRFERYGIPISFRMEIAEECHGNLNLYHDTCIAEITIMINGERERRFAIITDILSLREEYDITCHHIVAGMTCSDPTPGIAGSPCLWYDGDGPVVAVRGAVEWIDEDYHYHVTEKGGVTGSNVYLYREYVE